jgi:hypothetical protein
VTPAVHPTAAAAPSDLVPPVMPVPRAEEPTVIAACERFEAALQLAREWRAHRHGSAA